MNRETTTAHRETWEFFSTCIQIFKRKCKGSKDNPGVSFLANLFNVSNRQVQRWSCDPRFSESAQSNPMDKYELILEQLCEIGRHDVARGAVDRQAQIVGCNLDCEDSQPDKTNLIDEILDDLPALTEFQDKMRNFHATSEQEAREARDNLINEIKQTYAAYLRQKYDN